MLFFRPKDNSNPWDLYALFLLWLLSLFLAFVELGKAPYGPFDEGIVSRVAFELSKTPWPQNLLPTFWGNPYLNKPPGLHLLIAFAIRIWRYWSGGNSHALPPEWVVRLVPAFLSTLIVPIIGLIQRTLLPGNLLAPLSASAIVMTVIPIAAHGRTAMLDGTQLSAMYACWLFMLLFSVSYEHTRAYGVGAGLCGSCLLLLKAPVVIPVVLIGTLFLATQPKRIHAPWGLFLAAFLIGLLPGISWHIYNLLLRGDLALHMWLGEGLARNAPTTGGYQGSWTYLPKEFLRGGLPWLPLWCVGIISIMRRHRALPSDFVKWSLGLTFLSAALALSVRPYHLHYSVLIWPPFALISGYEASALLSRDVQSSFASRLLGFSWIAIGAAFLLLTTLYSQPMTQAWFATFSPALQILSLPIIFAGGMLLLREVRLTFFATAIVFVAWYLGLVQVFSSNQWHPWAYGVGNREHALAVGAALSKIPHPGPIYTDNLNYIRSWYLDVDALYPLPAARLPQRFTALTHDAHAVEKLITNTLLTCETTDVLPQRIAPGPSGVINLYVQKCGMNGG
jgi:hypothetical protein